MEIRDENKWRELVAKNSDPYGSGVIRFAEKWADLMEQRIASGQTVAECADKTSHDADTEGITGFMYGCAVGALAEVWEHGEELRRWHNLDIQIGDEGERANESCGTLNPASINFGGPADRD